MKSSKKIQSGGGRTTWVPRKTLHGVFTALALLASAGMVAAEDNTGTGGTITYTDANGLNPVASPPYVGGFVVHKFTASDNLNIPVPVTADVLVVAGGGGGGKFGAGGGAGGFLFSSGVAVSSGITSVTVGAGGAGTGTAGAVGDSGGNSVFQSFTAYGGGGGGSRTGVAPYNGIPGNAGGSGGGASASDSGAVAGGAGTVGQGNAGGDVPWTSGSFWGSGGGGGAGAAGDPATGPAPATSGGNGGVGLSSSITGNTAFYAGGGGGGTWQDSTGTVGVGGNGGGGAATKVAGEGGTAGTANTGGGGGGAGLNGIGGTGGSGIVVVKYPYVSDDLAVTVTAPTANQTILFGTPITATATVVNGTGPYSVTFHQQLNGGGFIQVGSADTESPYEANLGTLAAGTYQIYATVTDSVAGTATSATNTFYVYKEGNSGTGGTITYTDANGLNPRNLPPYSDGYVVHKFTASGTLDVPMPVTAEVLVVAGGGGGGGNGGGGGGAGGLQSNSAYAVEGPVSVTVGAGGAVHPNDGSNPTNGGNSSFGTITANGGGGGSSRDAGGPGASGGSGGGGGGADGGSRYFAGAGTSGQGNNGGNGAGSGGANNTGGGGGGAGSAGTAGVSQAAGNGGTGMQSSIFASIAGSPAGWFAGGGGGGRVVNGTNGTGGNGGGGVGGGSAGAANTGGGGGGGGASGAGPGIGGSGIVLVRYPYDSGTFSVSITAPTENQAIPIGPSITATAGVSFGTAPHSVTFYLQTNGGGFSQVGSPDGTAPYEVDLGVLGLGNYQLYATVTDSTLATATSPTRTFTVVPPVIALSPTTLLNGRKDVSYVETTLSASGGTSPYTYDISAGSLPTGLILSSGGVLSGTPDTAGTYNFTVRATDSFSYTGIQAYTVNVSAGSLTNIWTQAAGGAQNWSTGANWSDGFAPLPIAGDTIDFSTVNIAANTTLTLEADRTAEVWKFGDTSGAQTWTVNGGNQMILAGTTPTINVVQNTAILNSVIAGTQGLTKTGAGTLTLTATNTFSGDLVINAGAMDNANAAGFGTGTNITFTGNGTVVPGYLGAPGHTLAKGITVNPGVTATFNMPNQFYHLTFTGPVTGSGTIAATCSDNGKGSITFSNAASTFTGALWIGSATRGTTVSVNSLGDGANPIQIYRDTAGDATATPFALGAGATSPLLFNSREIELMGATTGATINNNNATVTNTITINTPLKVTGVGNKTLTLGGSNSGTNTFGGVIADGTGSVISVTKAGAGKWVLGGANTYSGNTTVSGGTLVLAESTGALNFKVTDATTNKVTGAGTATFNGSFNIDTTAVTLGDGSIWTLVDVTNKSYGPAFSVTDFTNLGVDSSGPWRRVTGSQIWIFSPASGKLFISAPGEIVSLGIPGYSGVINQTFRTIDLTVPYTPYGISGLASIAPNFALSSGTCDQTSGAPPSPTFAAANPAYYVVTDGATTNDYEVTVNVTPAATASVMSNVYFPGYGYAWATDATNFRIVVPTATVVTNLAPTFSISQFASVDFPSGTARDFTTPQTYTVTAEDGSPTVYTLTVQVSANSGSGAYQQKVLASGPVSYWPLNESSGTTAFDLASGINNATYGGTYTLDQTGLRPDGNPSVLFTTATTDSYTEAPYNASLNPKQFTIECWVKPNNTNVQYLASLQDRSASVPSPGRWGYALWKNNGSPGFGIMGGIGGTSTGVSVNGTTVAEVGKSYHVVGTYDGSTLKLYVNGNLEGSVAMAYVPATSTQPGFSIGSRNGTIAENSSIQDVAVYTRALTAEEIQAHTGYKLTYHGNGNTSGTVPSNPVVGYSAGDTVTVLGNTGSLAKTGFDFAGWNTQANGSGTAYLPGATFAIAADTILYARWLAPGYSSWQSVNGAVGQTPDQDHDEDGVRNGIEYFLGGPNGNTTGFTPLPAVDRAGDGTLSVTWTRAADYAGVYNTDFFVESSDTLDGTWTTATLGDTVTITGNQVKYTFPGPLGSAKFVRLKVTGP